MAVLIHAINKLARAGVLAALDSRAPGPEFKRLNLIYGFNGSGKSTLARCFASLQQERPVQGLPAGCQVEFKTSSGATVQPIAGNELARRVMVFNGDFIEENLLWATGVAKPVFYIGREQAELAKELEEIESKLPTLVEQKSGAEKLQRAKEHAFANFKRERARTVSSELRQPGRKYEAPQLTADYASLDLGEGATLTDLALEAHREVCKLEVAMPQLFPATSFLDEVKRSLELAGKLARQSPALVTIEQLQNHPDMLVWVKEGKTYHEEHGLSDCLLCGSPFTEERKQLLSQALDDGFQRYLDELAWCRDGLNEAISTCRAFPDELPRPNEVTARYRQEYEEALTRLKASSMELTRKLLDPALKAINAKIARPTGLPSALEWSDQSQRETLLVAASEAIAQINGFIGSHNSEADRFHEAQVSAREGLRRHFLREFHREYNELIAGAKGADENLKNAWENLQAAQIRSAALRSAMREQGVAAEKMNKLIAAYLGHNELSIASVDTGYEIGRQGRTIQGMPSEGEKTAIALCYFLTTLEAEGRSIKDLIVVVDDPISSLDSRALNFACALILSRLESVSQLFVLTHNQNCMNEFKKAWRGFHRPRNEDTPASASMLFLDVKIPKGAGQRSATIVEMSKLLREYDSEYHYLFDHVLKFEANDDPEYEYAYMMPNVLRRVMDVFLAFKCPGSAGFSSKIAQLCKQHSLDSVKMAAFDRLIQLESHSDSLDDLIGFSSMTLEESRAATDALLRTLEKVDPDHLNGLRRLCS